MTKRETPFSTTSLHSLLKNPKYTGNYIYNRSAPKDFDGKRNGHKHKDESEFIVVELGCPAIISKEDFDRVQEIMSNRMQTREHSRTKERYILKGKILCGECGGAFVGTRRRRTVKGGIWTAYGCNCRHRTKNSGCTNADAISPLLREQRADCQPKMADDFGGEGATPFMRTILSSLFRLYASSAQNAFFLKKAHRQIIS